MLKRLMVLAFAAMATPLPAYAGAGTDLGTMGSVESVHFQQRPDDVTEHLLAGVEAVIFGVAGPLVTKILDGSVGSAFCLVGHGCYLPRCMRHWAKVMRVHKRYA